MANMGHEAAQEAIRCMGLCIDKHFSTIGGFSTRHNSNEFVTVLPYSELAEAESMLKGLVQDFKEQGIHRISACAHVRAALEDCVEFAIMAGIAQGQPIEDIDSVIDTAKHQQQEIARLQCF